MTGPTGSGKSSTLYALISSVNTRDKSIVSVEDPVEYRLDGVKQIQINTRAGMTFPSALRSTLRADPDVILVGEVRDAETARIAADASITGHLVLSTLHATRSAAAPIRLIDMGVEPYLVASAVSCIAAQRLARKLCDSCASPIENPDIAQLRRLGATDEILAEGINVRAADGLLELPQDRLPRPRPDLRDHARHRGHHPPHRRARAERRHRADRGRAGHGHVAHRRAAPRAAAATSASKRWRASFRSGASRSVSTFVDEAHDAERAEREAVDAERRQALRLEVAHQELRREVRGDAGDDRADERLRADAVAEMPGEVGDLVDARRPG